MGSELARRLGAIADFDDPSPALEQYRTPADVAAQLLSRAAIDGDLRDRTVVDLGTGTGMLAVGAALAGARRSIGIEIDPGALERARESERRVDPAIGIDWIIADATDPPLDVRGATVLTNPPFGAQRGNEHADRDFLAAAARIADVSYTVHNAGSRSFVESFVEDTGGAVTHAYEATLSLPRQFDHHREADHSLAAEVYRIEWSSAGGD
ncbi:MAG: METTL5 family protein [Halanaeroarchaeum sp.]